MRTTPFLFFFVVLATLAACVDGDELATVVEPSCGGHYPFVGSITLPPMKGAAKPTPDAPLLAVDLESILLDHARVSTSEPVDAEALRDRLRENREHLTRIAKFGGEVNADRLLLAIDAAVPAATAATVLDTVRVVGFTELLALGAPASQPELPPLPDPELAAQLSSGADPSMRAVRAAEAIEGAIWLCPDLTTIFEALAAVDPAQKCELMVAGFREMGALCVGDQDALITVLTLMSVPDQYTTFRRLRLPDAPVEGATWDQMLERL